MLDGLALTSTRKRWGGDSAYHGPMSPLGDVPVFVQPLLQMKPSTAAKIAAGTAYQIGGVVREVGTGRLVEMLKDAAPVEEAAKQAATKAAEVTSKLNLSKIDLSKIDIKTAGK